VIRDILGVGLGARPIANTDAFFVGPLDLPQAQLPKG
jgi:phosphoribosylformylglycinamidine synthase